MAAERNFFHRWRGMTTIGYELGVIWEMSVIIFPLYVDRRWSLTSATSLVIHLIFYSQ